MYLYHILYLFCPPFSHAQKVIIFYIKNSQVVGKNNGVSAANDWQDGNIFFKLCKLTTSRNDDVDGGGRGGGGSYLLSSTRYPVNVPKLHISLFM